MSGAYRALLNGTSFVTSPGDMHRDYIGAQELAAIIDGAAGQAAVNTAVDTYTARPAGKFEILQCLGQLGLDWRVVDDGAAAQDRVWYSLDRRQAEQLGYRPARSSLDVVETVAREFLSGRPAQQVT